ncbi:ubiquinol-cytochrome-c reductase complex assembly factor 3 [Danio rerio]|uniref:Ubiquinol-cytochrome-c reductase complex assembly factor 3 n=1 Tax=Danio rerio TaxID=7955 RepID=UQCC3_DANRE|nr:ubiquinol-cytochrome-c reductase complex assembly factor 3 [Danio rerio]B3DFP2.2 RecName: Full=Ubiquinol-cytochrome-c reductase complex assembly factor 3 [Danio rerio]|eukprot:NP_001189365.1 ubiquinol-cytochrome-c reductase complex assembly factor 3 [Danio rerio]
MSGMRILTGSVALGGLTYAIWIIFSPGEERKKEILKSLPEANPVRMEETRKRNAIMLQVLKDAAETNDNIARGFGSQK